MLVLNRKEGESLTIGDDVRITLVKASHSKARIGISAPRSVMIARDDAKVTLTEEFCRGQADLMGAMVTALERLVGSTKQPDESITHTVMRVHNEHLRQAQEVVARFEAWARGLA